ncbi:hypothetical protein Tco_1055410, partial [Tanacetum coccineum]
MVYETTDNVALIKEKLKAARDRQKCYADNSCKPLEFEVGNMEMEPEIENMTISEYLEYEATKERRLWEDVRSRRSPTNYNEADVDSFYQNKKEDQEEDGDDGDTFDMWDITVEDVEQIKQFFKIPDEINEIVQPLIPEPIHTTPPNDDYVAPATKSVLDELLEEFRDE